MSELQTENRVDLTERKRGMRYEDPAHEVGDSFRVVKNMTHYLQQGTNLQQLPRVELFKTLV